MEKKSGFFAWYSQAKYINKNFFGQCLGKSLLALICIFFPSLIKAQKIPLVFVNNTEGTYTDDDIYIALIGQFTGMNGVWMDMSQSVLKPMAGTENTLLGPAWASAPGGGKKYGPIFTKLSQIPQKTIQIPYGISATRIFISFKSPMYLYIFPDGGYAGADLNNPNDPSDGVRWEIVELSWLGASGLFINTSRVDSYQYPMGLDVRGFTNSGGINGSDYLSTYTALLSKSSLNDTVKHAGEILGHQEILNLWEPAVSTPFKACKIVKTHSLDKEPIIEQPSKIPAFKAGGVSQNFFDSYIKEVWNTYRSRDLLINFGDIGTYKGRVNGDKFSFSSILDPSQVGHIYGVPTTQDVIEGKGFLASTPQSGPAGSRDLQVQAQICAALNRHAIDVELGSEIVQKNHDSTRFYKKNPHNEYVRFFHQNKISYRGYTYAFAYDDVGDFSSTVQMTFPTHTSVFIGGLKGKVTPVSLNNQKKGVSKTRIQLKENSPVISIPGEKMYKEYNLQGGFQGKRVPQNQKK